MKSLMGLKVPHLERNRISSSRDYNRLDTLKFFPHLLFKKMKTDLNIKLQSILWDIPITDRMEIVNKILDNPVDFFNKNERIFVEALNTLSWYELIKLIGIQELLTLLTDSTIRKLFPVKRRTYYLNARRLLSKYCLPSSGQNT